MDFNSDAFSSSQMQSKLWMVQHLEFCLNDSLPTDSANGYRVWILGGWYGLTNLLIRTRNNIPISEVRSFDIDPTCEPIADAINNLWVWQAWQFKAHTCDVNKLEYKPRPDVVINSAVEHMDSDEWWNNIPSKTIVCLQASNMDHDDHSNVFSNTRQMLEKYQLRECLYEGTKRFQYDDYAFNRYMIIGFK
jgi:hypothetical protein